MQNYMSDALEKSVFVNKFFTTVPATVPIFRNRSQKFLTLGQKLKKYCLTLPLN